MCYWHGCDYRASRADALKITRAHTGEKPYVCNWGGCNYRASDPILRHTKSRMRARARIASPEANYVLQSNSLNTVALVLVSTLHAKNPLRT